MFMPTGLKRVLFLLVPALLTSATVLAADIPSRVLRVLDGNKIVLAPTEHNVAIEMGSIVTLSVNLPKIGPVAISTKWLVEQQTGQGLIAAPQDKANAAPQIGYDVLITPKPVSQKKSKALPDTEREGSLLMLEAISFFTWGKNDKYDRQAIKLWRKAAQLGSTDAQVALGRAYAFGYGVDIDEFAALSWFERAAAKGNHKGQIRAGLFHLLGYETPKNAEKAIRYFTQAANQGNATAMFYLFDAYEDGNGVKADLQTALKWLEKSGDYGHSLANYALSSLYFSGQKEAGKAIVEKDEGRGLSYLLRAAKSGMPRAAEELAERFRTGSGVAQSDVLFRKWSQDAHAPRGQDRDRSVDHSNPYCLAPLECYGPVAIQRLVSHNSHTTDIASPSIPKKPATQPDQSTDIWGASKERQDMTKEEAIALGRAERQERLAHYNKTPLECDKLAAHPQDEDAVTPGISYSVLDAARAIEACQSALRDNPSERRFHTQLARGYFKQGNIPKALMHFEIAADMDSAQAMAFLGVVYKTGKGVPLNSVQSLQWFEKAAERGNLAGLVFTAAMLRDGEGTTKNPVRAAKLFEQAIKRGAGDAYYALGMMLDKGQGIERYPEKAAHYLLEAFYKDIPLANKVLLKEASTISRQTRWYIQEHLVKRGCYHGKLDGLFGKATRAALQDCKRRVRLK
ncbi:MAG: sel1 repeat family protein [Cohaesibacter sp.]|jgi:TPR repeat protein|nr:sel1 repeat family protein [Cohaesibacter sp.]